MDSRRRPHQLNSEVQEYLIRKNPELQEMAASRPEYGPALPAEDEPAIEKPVEQPKSLADQYKDLANIDKELAATRKSADRKNKIVGVIQGITQAFAGPQHTSESAFSSFRKSNDDKVDNVLADRKRRIEDLASGRKFQEMEGGDDASKSLARQMQAAGLTADDVKGMSFDQMLSLIKARQKGEAGGYQQASIVDKDGHVRAAIFDKKTGKYIPSEYDKGFAYGMATDPMTKNIIAVNKANPSGGRQFVAGGGAASSSPGLQPLKDETPANFQARLAADETKQKERAKAGVESEIAVADAESKAETRHGLSQKYLQWYDEAAKSGKVGPGRGQLSSVKNNLGMSQGSAYDNLNSQMLRDTNQYVKDITGAAMTNSEAARIMAVMPTPNMDRKLFETRLKLMNEEVDRILAEKKTKHGKLTGSKTPTTPTVDEGVVQQYMKKYPNKSREQIIQAIQKQGGK